MCTILCVNSDEEGWLVGSPTNSGEGDKEQTLVFLHMAFICEFFEMQVREGRFFFFFTHIRIPQTVGTSQQLWIS